MLQQAWITEIDHRFMVSPWRISQSAPIIGYLCFFDRFSAALLSTDLRLLGILMLSHPILCFLIAYEMVADGYITQEAHQLEPR